MALAGIVNPIVILVQQDQRACSKRCFEGDKSLISKRIRIFSAFVTGEVLIANFPARKDSAEQRRGPRPENGDENEQ